MITPNVKGRLELITSEVVLTTTTKKYYQNTNLTFDIITLALCLQLSLPPQNLSMVGKSEAVGLPQMVEEPRLFPSDIRCHHYITPGALVTTDL